ncbi:MAG TPA: prenyltransferase/squalene oxidase repeat-containing protein [Pirellulales bacterium]|nr:prenyltransferase/squalene oxidase repeat-containing protein [Pirellulales bacterium]
MARTFSLALLGVGLSLTLPARAEEPSPVAGVERPQAQQAVERSIGYLQAEMTGWWNTRKCAACHHLPMPLWALAEAGRQNYPIDKELVANTAESLLGDREKLLATKIFPNPADPPDPRPQGRGLNMGLPFLVVAARSLPTLNDGQKESLRLIAEEIVKKQQADGSWEFFDTLRRPPINESQTTDAAWIILALDAASGTEVPDPHRAALEKASAWWKDAKRSDDLLQDKVFELLLALRAGRPRDGVQTLVDELFARQQADGGWRQLTTMTSDAFATGQVLYALSLADQTVERPEIRRAVEFLVATQKPDGSWPMTSRSTPNGEPGSAKNLAPITCAASSWAVLGLARLVPRQR